MLELVSIKDYCKRENITDAGARKRIVQKLAQSVKLGEIIYIVVENHEIEKLKSKLKDARKDIKLLKEQKKTVINQDEFIEKLEIKIERLEARNEVLNDKKENLYEKVIGQYDRLITHKG